MRRSTKYAPTVLLLAIVWAVAIVWAAESDSREWFREHAWPFHRCTYAWNGPFPTESYEYICLTEDNICGVVYHDPDDNRWTAYAVTGWRMYETYSTFDRAKKAIEDHCR